MDMFSDPPPSPKDYGYPIFFPIVMLLPAFVTKIIFGVFLWVKDKILSILSFLNLYISEGEKTKIRLNKSVAHATTYEEWVTAAKQLDNMEGKSNWRKQKMSSYYDYPLIEHRLSAMRKHARNGDIDSMTLALRAGLLRNLGGMGNPQLYAYSRFGTKQLIEEYIDEVVKQLLYICETDFHDFPLEKKFDFFFETRQAFGRTALLLSGGATLGMYHFGVIKALWEANLLPRIISGSSVGSIVASLVAVVPDDKIHSLFEPGNWRLNAFESLGPGSTRRRLYRLLTKGVLMDVSKLQECLRDNIGDVTFKEAYQRSKRILNITVASTSNFEFPRLLNYLTAPNVLIWSAACASCALKFLYEPVELMAKDKNGGVIPYHPSGLKWSDGSVASDLPMVRLSELFNVNHFLVSQVNPHVVPFVSSEHFQTSKFGLWPLLKFIAKSEIQHRVTQLAQLGLMPPMLSMLHPLITQKYVGDITIIPEITIKDYLFLVSNPTPEMIQRCVMKGMKTTFPKLAIIKNHCAIEYALEYCTAVLREKLIDTNTITDPHRRRSFYADNHMTTLLESVRSSPPQRYPSFSSSPYNRRPAASPVSSSRSTASPFSPSRSNASPASPPFTPSSSSSSSTSADAHSSAGTPPSPSLNSENFPPQPSSPQLPEGSTSPREFL